MVAVTTVTVVAVLARKLVRCARTILLLFDALKVIIQFNINLIP